MAVPGHSSHHPRIQGMPKTRGRGRGRAGGPEGGGRGKWGKWGQQGGGGAGGGCRTANGAGMLLPAYALSGTDMLPAYALS
eukprot:2700507-Rhodomonas_salina.1